MKRALIWIDRLLMLVLIGLLVLVLLELRSGKDFSGLSVEVSGAGDDFPRDGEVGERAEPAGSFLPGEGAAVRRGGTLRGVRHPDPMWMVLDREWDRLMSTPAMDMAELSDAYLVLFGIPGRGSPDVDVRLEGAVLTVQMNVLNQREGSRHSGHMLRRIRLPWPIAPGVVPTYCLSNGVLRVLVPK